MEGRKVVKLIAHGSSAISSTGTKVGTWQTDLKFEAKSGTKNKMICGSMAEATHNSMELTSICEGLKMLKVPCEVEVACSKYVLNGANLLKHNHGRTKNGSMMKHSDIWSEIIKVARVGKHHLTFIAK